MTTTQPEQAAAVDISADASGLTRLSDTMPTRLIQSTGNLYWSSNPDDEFQSTPSAIFRASKSSQPGEEIQLYAETGWPDKFGALTFAKVNNEFYGYFVAGPVQIKRIPLGSVTPADQATVVANSPGVIGTACDLVTDGSFLCWADEYAIRSMPIGGGPMTALAAGGPFGEPTGFGRLSVLGRTLYYTDGKTIFSVPTGGGTSSTVVGNRNTTITALHVLEVPRPDKVAERLETPGQPIEPWEELVLIWGEADGGVYGMTGGISTYQEPTANSSVLSVYATDQRVLWSQDISPNSETIIRQLRMYYGNVTTTLASEEDSAEYDDVLADDVAAYWNDGAVEKYTF